MIDKKIFVYVSPINEMDTACVNLVNSITNIDFRTVNTIQELFPLLSDVNYRVDNIGIPVEDLYTTNGADVLDIINTLSTIIKCTVFRGTSGKPQKRNTVVTALVGSNTDSKIIRELQVIPGVTLGCRLGGSFTEDVVRENLNDMLAGNYTTPKSILNIVKCKKHENLNSDEILLTPRQTQIKHLVLTKGASNKVIAKALNISESTVKLHMGAIFKKYGVRNRTQLAVFTKE